MAIACSGEMLFICHLGNTGNENSIEKFTRLFISYLENRVITVSLPLTVSPMSIDVCIPLYILYYRDCARTLFYAFQNKFVASTNKENFCKHAMECLRFAVVLLMRRKRTEEEEKRWEDELIAYVDPRINKLFYIAGVIIATLIQASFSKMSKV